MARQEAQSSPATGFSGPGRHSREVLAKSGVDPKLLLASGAAEQDSVEHE
jgi:hypothetical protein